MMRPNCVMIIILLAITIAGCKPTPHLKIEKVRLALQSKNLSSKDRASLEVKLAIAVSEATKQAEPIDFQANWFTKTTAIVEQTLTPPKIDVKEDRLEGLISDPSSIGISMEDKFSTV